MSQAALFELKNVTCGYQGHEVLRIEELTLPKVPLTFILGPSGIGKSTLLEMLGLMSNTYRGKGDSFRYNGELDLMHFWQWSSTAQSQFRRNNFSFVFQQTNLIENLSIMENLCIPLMIQGYGYDEAARKVAVTAEKMNLAPALLSRKSSEVSGGQLQRAAFTRALSTDFQVLFGDEPTGNLDHENSRTLMGLLKQNLEERNAAAVVVSHDVGLAEAYADCIVTLEQTVTNGRPSGRLSNNCIKTTA